MFINTRLCGALPVCRLFNIYFLADRPADKAQERSERKTHLTMEKKVYATHRDSARDGYSWVGTDLKDRHLLQDKELMKKLLYRMQLAHGFEETILALFAQKLLHGTLHPGIGEEASGVGACAALEEQDYILATHRSHIQLIGRGIDVREMMCEIMGRENGTNHGRGGSMHLADPSKGILGANGILGAGAPLACGAALALKMDKKENAVTAVFYGDGASNEGAIHESMNLAATWKLPVMFVLMNNTYGMSTPLERAVNDMDLAKRGIPYGIKTFECDGNDVLAVYETLREARAFCTGHGEPVYIVLHTYRTSGHSKSDVNLYRTQEEIELWKSRSPIKRFENVLLENGALTAEEIAEISRQSAAAIEDAVEYAKASPLPAAESLLDNVWAD